VAHFGPDFAAVMKSIHVRLSEHGAHAALRMFAKRRGMTLANAAAHLVEEFIFGRDYVAATAPKPHKQEACAGQIYVIRAGHYYKIGKAKNAKERVRRLRLPFKEKIVLIADVADRHATERALHKQFAHKRVNGEWFRLSNSDVSGISGDLEGLKGK
jgi:hypothetical protein